MSCVNTVMGWPEALRDIGVAAAAAFAGWAFFKYVLRQ
jgi:hypothetical protein